MSLVIMSTLGLVESLLRGRLALVGLSAASETIGGIGDTLLDLVLGGLGGVRSQFLLGLCMSVSDLPSLVQ